MSASEVRIVSHKHSMSRGEKCTDSEHLPQNSQYKDCLHVSTSEAKAGGALPHFALLGQLGIKPLTHLAVQWWMRGGSGRAGPSSQCGTTSMNSTGTWEEDELDEKLDNDGERQCPVFASMRQDPQEWVECEYMGCLTSREHKKQHWIASGDWCDYCSITTHVNGKRELKEILVCHNAFCMLEEHTERVKTAIRQSRNTAKALSHARPACATQECSPDNFEETIQSVVKPSCMKPNLGFIGRVIINANKPGDPKATAKGYNANHIHHGLESEKFVKLLASLTMQETLVVVVDVVVCHNKKTMELYWSNMLEGIHVPVVCRRKDLESRLHEQYLWHLPGTQKGYKWDYDEFVLCDKSRERVLMVKPDGMLSNADEFIMWGGRIDPKNGSWIAPSGKVEFNFHVRLQYMSIFEEWWDRNVVNASLETSSPVKSPPAKKDKGKQSILVDTSPQAGAPKSTLEPIQRKRPLEIRPVLTDDDDDLLVVIINETDKAAPPAVDGAWKCFHVPRVINGDEDNATWNATVEPPHRSHCKCQRSQVECSRPSHSCQEITQLPRDHSTTNRSTQVHAIADINMGYSSDWYQATDNCLFEDTITPMDRNERWTGLTMSVANGSFKGSGRGGSESENMSSWHVGIMVVPHCFLKQLQTMAELSQIEYDSSLYGTLLGHTSNVKNYGTGTFKIAWKGILEVPNDGNIVPACLQGLFSYAWMHHFIKEKDSSLPWPIPQFCFAETAIVQLIKEDNKGLQWTSQAWLVEEWMEGPFVNTSNMTNFIGRFSSLTSRVMMSPDHFPNDHKCNKWCDWFGLKELGEELHCTGGKGGTEYVLGTIKGLLKCGLTLYLVEPKLCVIMGKINLINVVTMILSLKSQSQDWPLKLVLCKSNCGNGRTDNGNVMPEQLMQGPGFS
ncbi:uncharacterized protein EV420DRAFT_1474660 [Desarmillaria tabescens]|uniref:Uncharacterized protein n=1 Tax=Armillaria tabescens TaxID=1929756 RepID=A0AA39U5C7_ARMTA|nr:uncharacterized protein EV420DRAFT_1474660 [Desarmillaria tabescens]KAK0467340.1 hypothetical protein EV420DRAFT_1474660 [Desarmillaria tabescens]